MITDFGKHVNGNFDASQLLNRFQKPFSTDHWRFSSPAVMFRAAILIAVVTFAIGRNVVLRHKSQLQRKIQLSNFQSQRPLSSFTPNQREGIMNFFTVLFRTLDFTCTFLFHFVLHFFISCLNSL